MTDRLQHTQARGRSGVVLLVVMAMLALFAIVGLGFVFYAESASEGARFRRQAETLDLTDVAAEKLFSYALGQLIFDTANPKSAMHGHSLGRSLYGAPGGTVPFSGIGRPHPDTEQTLSGLTPFDGINVPYTYPDINNPFLAGLDPDYPGFLKERSFFRNGLSLRPRTLPAPPNGEGDVRNIDSLDGTTSPTNPAVKLHNDAFWMDLDFPIMTAKDGLRFKPLFAFSVLDLDGRLNLAVSGNYKADYASGGTTSRCGLGTWEINPARVLTIDKSEIANVFQGSGATSGRFGADNAPDNVVRFYPTHYSRLDYTGTSKDTISRAALPYSHFPTYGDWASSGTPYIYWGPFTDIQHAAGFDYFGSRAPATPAGDLKMAASNAEAILRWRDRGAPALTSDLFRLLPKNLTPQGAGGAQILNLITPYSMSLDTAHLAPFFVNDPNSKFVWNPGDPYPKSTSVTQTIPPALLGGLGELSAEFRSQIAAGLPRINLNRQGGESEDWRDCQILAKEIFDRLVRVTGALPPSRNTPFVPADPTDPQYKATRWLAQLAVNIVDYYDNHQDVTCFQWIPGPSPTDADYVFGVELANLLINEVYASVDNDPIDVQGPKPGSKYRINVWAELYNPMRMDAHPLLGQAQLRFKNTTDPGNRQPYDRVGYRLILAKNTEGIADSPTGLPRNYLYDRNDPNLGVVDWPVETAGSATFVYNGDQQATGDSRKGFYLVGPRDSFVSERKPAWTGIKWDHSAAGMSSNLKDMPEDDNSLSDLKVTLILQRLAIHNLKHNDNPAALITPENPFNFYNPYVTVDVFPDVPVCNSLKYVGAANKNPAPLSTFASSVGRYQPMQATGVKLQKPNPATTKNEPQHTFGRQNALKLTSPPNPADPNLKAPFDTVYHLDRVFASTAEALLAPAAPPWEVTQRFANPKLPLSAYSVCQNDVQSLLYRFLETVTGGDRSFSRQLQPFYYQKGITSRNLVGTGRQAILVPGKINLNTVSDEKVIQALFDRQSNSIFTDDDVHQFWLDLQSVRKTRTIAGFSDYTFDRNTRAVTMHNTLLGNLFKKMYDRAAKDGANEFEATEGLRKVMNNIAFTSNAFAVWVTAGFFEVDAAGNPVQEIGKNENRNVRHRMFAIVDRSQLVLPVPAQSQPFTTMTGASAQGATNATLAASSGFLRSQDPTVKVDFPWQIKAGSALTIDRGKPTEETVIVQSVNGSQMQIAGAGFLQQHNAGASVDLAGIQGPQAPLNRAPDGTTVPNFMLGYPGPQPQFNLREYSYVVPHYNIID